MSGAAADIRRAESLRHNASPNGTHNCLPLHQPFKSGHSTSGVGSAGGGSVGAVDYQPPIQCGEIISVAAAARKLRSTPTLSEISFEDLPPGGTSTPPKDVPTNMAEVISSAARTAERSASATRIVHTTECAQAAHMRQAILSRHEDTREALDFHFV